MEEGNDDEHEPRPWVGAGTVYKEAAGGTAERWQVPGSTHTGGLDARPAECELRVIDFFDRARPAVGFVDSGSVAGDTAGCASRSP